MLDSARALLTPLSQLLTPSSEQQGATTSTSHAAVDVAEQGALDAGSAPEQRASTRDRHAVLQHAKYGSRRVALPEVATVVCERSSISDEGGEGEPSETSEQRLFVVTRGQIPPELQPELERKFTETEIMLIFAKVHKTIAPKQTKGAPAALWVFGPSAVGKSSVTRIIASELFGSAESAVEVDGGHFREVHAGWGAVVNDGTGEWPARVTDAVVLSAVLVVVLLSIVALSASRTDVILACPCSARRAARRRVGHLQEKSGQHQAQAAPHRRGRARPAAPDHPRLRQPDGQGAGNHDAAGEAYGAAGAQSEREEWVPWVEGW